MLSYEIFYGTGGHSGPFPDEAAAINHAIRRGETTMLLCVRLAAHPLSVGGYVPCQLIRKDGETWHATGCQLLLRHQIPRIFHHLLKEDSPCISPNTSPS